MLDPAVASQSFTAASVSGNSFTLTDTAGNPVSVPGGRHDGRDGRRQCLTFTATHTYQTASGYPIVATVKNSAGASTGASASVQVNNVAPTVGGLKLNLPR